ncbi:hypothetical protein NQZ68_033312 [Dissostichus eleginoides]|nr:hypothetical protein NQZ68_033312 [Dissostichus eleginoides]
MTLTLQTISFLDDQVRTVFTKNSKRCNHVVIRDVTAEDEVNTADIFITMRPAEQRFIVCSKKLQHSLGLQECKDVPVAPPFPTVTVTEAFWDRLWPRLAGLGGVSAVPPGTSWHRVPTRNAAAAG